MVSFLKAGLQQLRTQQTNKPADQQQHFLEACFCKAHEPDAGTEIQPHPHLLFSLPLQPVSNFR